MDVCLSKKMSDSKNKTKMEQAKINEMLNEVHDLMEEYDAMEVEETPELKKLQLINNKLTDLVGVLNTELDTWKRIWRDERRSKEEVLHKIDVLKYILDK